MSTYGRPSSKARAYIPDNARAFQQYLRLLFSNTLQMVCDCATAVSELLISFSFFSSTQQRFVAITSTLGQTVLLTHLSCIVCKTNKQINE